MISLLDVVALRKDRPDLGLAAGQPGVVVHVHGAGGYDIEFSDENGRAVAIAGVTSADVMPVRQPAAAALTFQVFKRASGRYSWRLIAADAGTVATSAAYRSKAACMNSIGLLARRIRDARVMDQTAS
jgi:uncharacterized protein YegP (UPF0339 family)